MEQRQQCQYSLWGARGLDADKTIKTDGTGVKTVEYYDIAGRLIKIAVSNGTTEMVTAQYAYDLIGNCTSVTDNAGRVSEAQYNIIGQTTRTIVDPTGENIQSTFTYDLMGNPHADIITGYLCSIYYCHRTTT